MSFGANGSNNFAGGLGGGGSGLDCGGNAANFHPSTGAFMAVAGNVEMEIEQTYHTNNPMPQAQVIQSPHNPMGPPLHTQTASGQPYHHHQSSLPLDPSLSQGGRTYPSRVGTPLHSNTLGIVNNMFQSPAVGVQGLVPLIVSIV